ncbi:hypothetical protein SRO_6972 [Streptomyces rochei]|nr:hypothetical protein SRO_6972 [Streptomyces rochei]
MAGGGGGGGGGLSVEASVTCVPPRFGTVPGWSGGARLNERRSIRTRSIPDEDAARDPGVSNARPQSHKGPRADRRGRNAATERQDGAGNYPSALD